MPRRGDPFAWAHAACGAARGHPPAGRPSRITLAEFEIVRKIWQLHAAFAHIRTGAAQRLNDESAPVFQGSHPVTRLALSVFVRVVPGGVSNRPESFVLFVRSLFISSS